jgi:hypothetical protein
VLGTRGENEQQLGFRRHLPDIGIEQQPAQFLAKCRAPGFTCHHDRLSGIRQTLDEPVHLGRLAGALDPFEGHEATPLRWAH